MPTPRAMPAHRVSISRRMLQRSAACWDMMVIWAPESTKAFILVPFTCTPRHWRRKGFWARAVLHGKAHRWLHVGVTLCSTHRWRTKEVWARAVLHGKAHKWLHLGAFHLQGAVTQAPGIHLLGPPLKAFRERAAMRSNAYDLHL